MNTCIYCHCPIDVVLGLLSQHRSVYQCAAALMRRVAALEAELIEERVLTAELTDRLEICRECPSGRDLGENPAQLVQTAED